MDRPFLQVKVAISYFNKGITYSLYATRNPALFSWQTFLGLTEKFPNISELPKKSLGKNCNGTTGAEGPDRLVTANSLSKILL